MAEKQYSLLIVDDEQDILDALYDTFSSKYEVHTAVNAADALDILEKREITLVMSDQRMPGTTGTELFAQIEKSYPHVGKILFSGFSDIQVVIDAINEGSVDQFVSKPWDEHDITHIVLEVINTRLKKEFEERKQIESQLVQSAKMASLGEMVAGIAHELNNPLGFIYANLRNMKKFSTKIIELIDSYDQLDIPEETRKIIDERKKEVRYDYITKRVIDMIDRSQVGGDRMKTIIQDLKSFSRLDAAEIDDADLNGAIDVTLSIMISEYKNRIEIKKAYGDIPPVECYIGKINQVFMNLLVNACHAIEGKGEIYIATSMEGDRVMIEIRDTGSGIPEASLERIFDPFFTTKKSGAGTGLGLSISNAIIKQHHGEIKVNSVIGEGTLFTITLPVAMDAESKVAA
ncbi:MAG: ATP-binding protein [Desulfobacterales bacterium]